MGQEHEQDQDQEQRARRSRAPRRKFSPEFKRDAVEMVLTSGRPIAEVASELGLYDSTLGNWVRQAQVDRGEREGTTSSEAARIRELEAELSQVKSERDLLKRSVAFWVNERSTR
jgi:transposase